MTAPARSTRPRPTVTPSAAVAIAIVPRPLPAANAVAEDVNHCVVSGPHGAGVDDGTVTPPSSPVTRVRSARVADVLAERVADGRSARRRPWMGTILDILDADVRPTRMRCVLLPISVLRQALGVPGEAR